MTEGSEHFVEKTIVQEHAKPGWVWHAQNFVDPRQVKKVVTSHYYNYYGIHIYCLLYSRVYSNKLEATA